MAVIHGSKKEFETFIQKDYVLVDFYANWCGPCKMLAPILENVANNRDGFEVMKIDVDEEQDLARSLGIMSIPTLILYHNGTPLGKKIGFLSEEELTKWIEELKNE